MHRRVLALMLVWLPAAAVPAVSDEARRLLCQSHRKMQSTRSQPRSLRQAGSSTAHAQNRATGISSAVDPMERTSTT